MTKAKTAADGEILAVQYLRAVAALLVVYLHTKVYTDRFSWPLPREFGAAGVDLFFVISGFIMVAITARRPLPPRQFLLRRAIRVVPLYWLVTLAILAVALIAPGAMLHNLVTFDHVTLSLLFIPHFNPLEGNYTPFFKLGWTLNYEVYFYLAFAALLGFPALSLRRRLAALTGAFLAAVAFYLAVRPDDPFLHIYCNPVILEFLIGAFIGCLHVEGRLRRVDRRAAAALLVVGVLAMTLLFDSDDSLRVITAGLGAAALLLALLAIEERGALPSWPLLVLLGDASYSIYLAHPLVLTCARLAAKKLDLPVEAATPGIIAVCVVVALAVASGVAVHLWLERPILAALRARLTSRAAGAGRDAKFALPMRSVSAAALLGLAGALLLALGSPSRGGEGAPHLVHEEDFSRASRLDEDFWTYEIGFIRNHEQQYYRASNVFVDGGALILEARGEDVANAAYEPGSTDWTRAAPMAALTSGSIVTRLPMRYGVVEIVARLPAGAGTWPALWMLGAEGRPYTEIDMMEEVGQQPDLVFTSAHAGPSLQQLTNWSATTKLADLATRWRLYRLDWTAQRVAVSIDGETVLSLDPERAAAFRQPMHLRINLALGGEWGGVVDRNALPARLEIRSIRIFARALSDRTNSFDR
ncbi:MULTISPECIES: acyltransferase family protein [Methylosinus]|uniref:Acyltransferase n=1 Tax=Methylosinus trichosporium (strain ATCC 35070 / NCIMB 11131 / UNIQEM 75 / OB3b) TaxID=595536 RepID=A0A2D2D333_METT3|nr:MULTISPECIES: acyltransferase family protein [Methylosinus]ATQ69366.1 acyltransferase [Methylosinus trichosporium OB3b]OBS52881.1 acyltransferase [Methylosinus sp. 3S-1]